jgi:hypothetical protein
MAGIAAGCSDTPAAAPFELRAEPDFVHGVIPGERLILLVSIGEGAAEGPVDLGVEASWCAGTVEPSRIAGDEVAEVSCVVAPVSGNDEVPVSLVVTGRRGSVERRHEVSTVIVPWEDTISDTAGAILGVFVPWLAERHPDLGISESTSFDGTVVAPMLLVVTHYAYFGDDWEIGLSWHIMVAPQDWAQIYLRPRNAMTPTRAFELTSWSTSLGGGAVEIREVPPPAQVTR